jgi:hypothetical protein
MKMNEEWDIPDEYLAEIGRVIVRWNKLESLIELSLIELLGKDMTEGRSLVLFTHMAFPQKMDVLSALVNECLLTPAYGWLREYKPSVEPLLREAAKRRNEIAHGKWGMREGTVGKSSITARGTLKLTNSQVSIAEIEEASVAIVKAADALASLVFFREKSATPQSGQ